jgi:hypothetical protein
MMQNYKSGDKKRKHKTYDIIFSIYDVTEAPYIKKSFLRHTAECLDDIQSSNFQINLEDSLGDQESFGFAF